METKEKNKKIVEDIYRTFVYGYPIVVLEIQKNTLTNTVEVTSEKAPVNQLLHAKSTASAEDKYIVMLNMDTVYSQVYFDLRKGPLYFRKPKTDRYATALLLDAYGNTIDILGTGSTGGNEEVNAVLVGPKDKDIEIPEHFTKIMMPTNDSWSLIRVITSGDQDREAVHQIQQGFDVRPFDQVGKDYVYPKGTYVKENDYITFEKINALTIQEYFDIFNRLIGDNLGLDPDEELLNAVRPYGIGAGLKFDINSFDDEVKEELAHFTKRMVSDFDKASANGGFSISKEGWTFPRDTIANFGREYLYRANVAWGGIGVNPVSMAIYPTAVTDAEGQLLHSDHNYVFHFSSLPPVNGFWSLTVYGDDKFQVPNEIGRYGINDRSEFTVNEDGSFDLYVQRNRPEEERVANWIPSGTRGIIVVLRLYLPKEEILNGTWNMPVISKEEE